MRRMSGAVSPSFGPCVREGWRVVRAQRPTYRVKSREERELEGFRDAAFNRDDLRTYEHAQRRLRELADERQPAASQRHDMLPTSWIVGGVVMIALLVWAGFNTGQAIVGGAVLLVGIVLGLFALGEASFRWGPFRVWDDVPVQAPIMPGAPGGATAATSKRTLTRMEQAVAAGAQGNGYRTALLAEEIDPPTWGQLDGGGGYQVIAELPPGVTAADVSIDRIAGALGLPTRQVRAVPSPHGGELRFTVADHDPANVPAAPWAGLSGSSSFADACPLGTSDTGKQVAVKLASRHALVAGTTGSGKTWTLRLLALWAAADAKATMGVLDLKADGELGCLAEVADYFGEAPDAAAVAYLRSVVADMDRRYAWRRAHAGQDVAAALGHRVLVVDEVHRLFSSSAPTDLAVLFEDVMRRGRSAGVVVLAGTQVPGRDSIPQTLLDQFNVRVAGRLVGWAETLTLATDKGGLCRDLGEGEFILNLTGRGEPTFVKVSAVNTDEAARLCRLAAAARPTVAPAGHSDTLDYDEPEEDGRGAFLTRVWDVLPEGAAGLHWSTLARRLDMSEGQIRSELEAAGVGSTKLREPGGPPKAGVSRESVREARLAHLGGSPQQESKPRSRAMTTRRAPSRSVE